MNFDLGLLACGPSPENLAQRKDFPTPRTEAPESDSRRLQILEQSVEFSKAHAVDNSRVQLARAEFVGVCDALNILVQVDQFLVK